MSEHRIVPGAGCRCVVPAKTLSVGLDEAALGRGMD